MKCDLCGHHAAPLDSEAEIRITVGRTGRRYQDVLCYCWDCWTMHADKIRAVFRDHVEAVTEDWIKTGGDV